MPLERPGERAEVVEVLDRVLDKGIVIDASLRLSLAGLDLLGIEAWVVVASIDTYVAYSDAVAAIAPPTKTTALRPHRGPTRGRRAIKTSPSRPQPRAA